MNTAGRIVLSSHCRSVLERLSESGFEAYAVGGCVRDCLMGKKPADWDVCTSAEPAEIKACFEGFKTLDTGIKHGTVTVICCGRPVEVTTFRIDGNYSDGRHPEAVTFTTNLKEDLARRDFTVNAMAYSPEKGLADPFGGQRDLAACRLRCVGNAQLRFQEDALRIMRGLRFSAVLGFSLEDETEKAMRRCCRLLDKVSRERVNAELSKLLLGADADRVMKAYGDILRRAVKGLQPAETDYLPKQLSVRLAAVFPEDAKKYLQALKYSGQIVKEASSLSRLAAEGNPPRDETGIKKILASDGETVARLYFSMFGEEAALQEVLDSGCCFSLSQLAVSGDDLIEAGFPRGRAVGQMLSVLLELVIEGKLANEKHVLLQYAKERIGR